MRKGRKQQRNQVLPGVNHALGAGTLFQLTTSFRETLGLFGNIFRIFATPISACLNL
jgi:hypothetical protein